MFNWKTTETYKAKCLRIIIGTNELLLINNYELSSNSFSVLEFDLLLLYKKT